MISIDMLFACWWQIGMPREYLVPNAFNGHSLRVNNRNFSKHTTVQKLSIKEYTIFYYQNIYTKLQYNMYNANASALWTHYITRLCKIDSRNNNDKTVQPIEYKLTIPNTFHI